MFEFRILKLFSLVLFITVNVFGQVNPVNLTCEYLTNPEGIDMQAPRFF